MYRFLKFRLKNLFLIFALFLACSTGIKAQEAPCEASCDCEIIGTVVDRVTGEPLPFASVRVEGTDAGTYTDEKGVFHLHHLCSDEFNLSVSYVGYKSVTHHHDVYHESPEIFLSPLDVELESVVVEGERMASGQISLTESRMHPEELENYKGESLGEALAQITGVSTVQTGQNVVKPVVHGLHSSRILIINNGLRHENQRWGVEHAPEIDPSLTESIVLIKGASAVKYGPNALGGVVVVNPPQPELSTNLSGEAEITGKSNGRDLSSSLFLQQGSSRFAWTAQAAGLYQGDLHAPDYQLTNTGARELSLSVGSRYHRKKFDINLYYSYFDQTLGILRGSVVGNLNDLAYAIGNEPPANTREFSYEINTPHQRVNHQLFKLNGDYNFTTSRLSYQYGLQYNHRQEFDVRRGTNNNRPSLNLQLLSHTFDTEWQHPVIGRWQGSVGAQWLYQNNRNIAGTNTIPFVPNYDNTNIGFYIIESALFGKLTAEAGLRFDALFSNVRGRDTNNEVFTNSFSYRNITGSLGIFSPLGDHGRFRSNLGTAWRPPNISELYSFGKHEFILEYGLWRFYEGQTKVFTAEERPVGSEMGIKWVNTYEYQKNETSVELSGYINYLQNFIYTQAAGITTTVRGAFPYFVYNQTNALLMGIDGSLIQEHSTHWQSQLKASFLSSRDLINSEFFVGMAPNRLSYTFRYKHPKLGFMKNFSAGLESSYTFKQLQAPPVISVEEIIESTDDAQENAFVQGQQSFDFLAPPEGYFLANSYGGFSAGRLTYRLQVRNIFNTSYRNYTDRLRYFTDDLGRNFLLSVKYQF